MKKQKKILLSFVGSNDAGKLLSDKDGAILTALKNEKFDEVILLWTEGEVKGSEIKYSDIVRHIRREIKKRKLADKSTDEELFIKDVTDHNEIYIKLKEFTDTLEKDGDVKFSAAISSGTPAMSVCWILLAESGDFSEKNPLKLIKVKDPRYGKQGNAEVKLGTGLPKIISLREEINKLKEDLIPEAFINVKLGSLTIGNTIIKLSPIEFCYYRYFAERAIDELDFERFSGLWVSLDFMEKIYSFHEESFEFLDLNREELKKLIEKGTQLGIQTFRGNISKLNKKIKNSLNNQSLFEQFSISTIGTRGARCYGIKAPKEKIKFI